MRIKLSSLAQGLGLELKGEDRDIVGVGTLESAGPEELSFLADPGYVGFLESTAAAAVILEQRYADRVRTALLSENPYLDFARALEFFAKPQGCLAGQSELAYIHASAKVHPKATVYPFAFIGAKAEIGAGTALFPGCYVGERCRVGPDCILYPRVTLMAGTILGTGVVIHAGAVLGADGFGFAQSETGREKIPQMGKVVVEDFVEIGANTTIDRATLDRTLIGKGTKIDNLVQVGHNVTMGEGCVLVSQVGISGSTRLGRGVVMAGQVGVADHVAIGDNVIIGPKSGVAKDIPEGKIMGGIPVMERGTYLRSLAAAPKLPDLLKRVNRLEKELAGLKKIAGLRENNSE
ncbi:MAG: UDP-3-O-(3-hydroxymyristoyl)glucosamine N-acyltransferase [Thermodesulfobacteriota bacterium]|nr:UDP-3-O-(3-hydroxymyristoyl)glucosamine N-acyltransferase [Thermodesulfobacteriota bacterium]